MKVDLARNWFDPSGSRRLTRFNPHEFPDSWKDQLPKGAKILDEPIVEENVPEEKKSILSS